MNIHGLFNHVHLKIIRSVIGIFGMMVKMVRSQTTGKVFLMVRHGNMMKKQNNIIYIYSHVNNQI